jgi:hypothetical protein
MENCLYVENSGPIYFNCFMPWPDFILNNCTISRNMSDAISIGLDDGSATITNSIIADNDGIGIGFLVGDISLVSISYNDVFGNVSNYDGIPDPTGENGNISENPQFVDGDPYDYHLQPNSPCIDAGDPGGPYDPDGTIADMGTYYYHQYPIPTLSEWGMIILALLLLAAGTVAVVRRRKAITEGTA